MTSPELPPTQDILPRSPSAVQNQRGQAIVEAGIVIAVIIILSIGVVEYGRAFQVSNMITHALRDAARQAAVVSASARDADGMISNTGVIKSRVKTVLNSTLDSATVNALSITIAQTTVNGTPLVEVNVQGSIPYTFNLVGQNFAIDRTVSFRDEGR